MKINPITPKAEKFLKETHWQSVCFINDRMVPTSQFVRNTMREKGMTQDEAFAYLDGLLNSEEFLNAVRRAVNE